MKLKIIFLYIFLISILQAEIINIKITDENENPIANVLIENEIQNIVANNFGRASISLERDEIVYTFSRIGYKSQRKTFGELRTNSHIIMQIELLESVEFIVKDTYLPMPFRASSENSKIDLSDTRKIYITVEDIFRDQPQISIKGIRLAGEQQIVSLGGHQGRHTIIMLDNIILNPSGQAVDLSSIPASQISYIEIVKNNISVDTGSGGIAGMIILHTKRTDNINQVHYSHGIGSYGSAKNNISINYFQKNIKLILYASHLDADNNFKYKYREEVYERKFNKKNIKNFSSEIQYYNNFFHFTYDFKFQDFYKELPGPINNIRWYEEAFQEGNTFYNGVLFSMKDLNFLISKKTSHSTYNNTKAPISIFYAIDENIHSVQTIKIDFMKEIGIWRPSIGGEIKDELYQINDKLYNRNFLPKTKQTTSSVFSSQKLWLDYDNYSPEIIGSIRIDENTKFKTNTCWRWEFNHAFYSNFPFKIKSSIGTSYNIPSFYDLYWKGDSQTTGNPNLKLEESFGWRVEGYTDTNPLVGLAKWNNRTNNLIYWTRSNTGWKPSNLTKAEIDNMEVFGRYVINGQTINVVYTKTDARNKSEGIFYNKYIVYTPEWKINAQLSINIKCLNQVFSYTAQGKQWSTHDQLIPPLKKYEIYDTQSSIKFRLWKLDTTIIFNLYNIFDIKYSNFDYVPEPGRTWETQLTLKYIY